MDIIDPTSPRTGGEQAACAGGLPVGIISNPHSGRNRRRPGRVERIVADHPGVHHCLTRSADDIPAALARLAERGVGVLAINGGDGTVGQVLGRLLEAGPFERLPLIVLLPGGTTNMNVGDVGLRGSLERAVQRLCDWAEQGLGRCRLLRRAVLRVQPAPDSAAVYGMFFGAGAIIQGIEYCQREVHTRGIGNEIGPGLAMARTLWGIARRDPRFVRPVTAAVAFDGGPERPPEDILLLLSSTLERLFLGMRPWWGDGDGPLHTTLVRHDAPRLIRNLPALLRGRPNRHVNETAGYRSRNLDSLQLAMDGPFTLDGELFHASREAGPVDVRSGGIVTFARIGR